MHAYTSAKRPSGHTPRLRGVDCAMVMAAIAARTSRIRLTSGVSVLPLHDPVSVYQDLGRFRPPLEGSPPERGERRAHRLLPWSACPAQATLPRRVPSRSMQPERHSGSSCATSANDAWVRAGTLETRGLEDAGQSLSLRSCTISSCNLRSLGARPSRTS